MNNIILEIQSHACWLIVGFLFSNHSHFEKLNVYLKINNFQIGIYYYHKVIQTKA